MAKGKAQSAKEVLKSAGQSVRAAYVAGSLLAADHVDALGKLDFVVVQELFETESTAHADVVFPAASFAEVDGTFTNNDGLVQRVRKSIEPVHQSLPDWMIVTRLAKELGMDFGYERSASAVFRELADRISAYAGLRYPALKDESSPVQVKHAIVAQRDLATEIQTIRRAIDVLPDQGEKAHVTPSVGHELFKPGTLISKTPQIQLLAAGSNESRTRAPHPSGSWKIAIQTGSKIGRCKR